MSSHHLKILEKLIPKLIINCCLQMSIIYWYNLKIIMKCISKDRLFYNKYTDIYTMDYFEGEIDI
jgi:hypothetical protein